MNKNVNDSKVKAGKSMFLYRLTQAVSGFVSGCIFKRKMLRNEIKGKKGPFVVIANHQAMLDFVNLIGVTKEPMTFVISESFYNALPVKGIMSKLGLIPKQQFQTDISDLRKMKGAIDNGEILAIYPAGLMCEDGLSTPIPAGTYQFLKWLKADVYVARTYGTYFSSPKWSKGLRAGCTYLDVYKLFDKDELAQMELHEVKERTDEALLFDAYREQEKLMVKYHRGSDIRGVENVLYRCPHCGKEFGMKIRGRSVIYCEHCGFAEKSDKYGFLHKISEVGEEIRYVSDWSMKIYDSVCDAVMSGELDRMSTPAEIRMINGKKKKFVTVGRAEVTLEKDNFLIEGELFGNEERIYVPTAHFASMPFSPGKHMEIQQEKNIYRCLPDDPRVVQKFVNVIKVRHAMSAEAQRACKAE